MEAIIEKGKWSVELFFGQVENVGLFNTDIGDPDSLLNSNLKLLAEAAGYSPLENEEQGVDETATVIDTVGVNKNFSLDETAIASDSFINDTGLVLNETGEGIESALLGKDIGIDESASVIETIASGKNFIFPDNASGNDNNLVEKNIFIGDAAAGEENILLGKAIICADTAAGEDASVTNNPFLVILKFDLPVKLLNRVNAKINGVVRLKALIEEN